MKSKKNQPVPVTGTLLKQFTNRQKAGFKAQMKAPKIGSKPLSQPALSKDSGGGYNPGSTFPQD